MIWLALLIIAVAAFNALFLSGKLPFLGSPPIAHRIGPGKKSSTYVSSGTSPGKSIQEPGRITVACHHCRAAVSIPEGKSDYVRCPKCDQQFFVQDKSDAKSDDEAARYGGQYVGEVKNGKRHGKGTFTWPNGNKYVGDFKDDKRTGQGTYTWGSGGNYVGEFKDGKIHGKGTFTYANGNKYVGEWKDRERHGHGTYTYADGSTYVGEWKDGKQHGQGTHTWPDGTKQVGEWKDGYSLDVGSRR